MKINRRRLLGASGTAIAGVIAGCIGDDNADSDGSDQGEDGDHDDHDDHSEEGETEVSEPEPRLLVADASVPELNVLDLSSGESLKTVEIDEADPIIAAPTYGQLAAVTQVDAGKTALVDSGTRAESHGDHAHYYVDEPQLLDELSFERPIHTSIGDRYVSIFDDGVGSATFVNRAASLEAGHAEYRTIETGSPHHGGAVALSEELFAVSWPEDDQDGGLPHEVAVFHGDERVGVYDCPALHGDVAVDGGGAFAGGDRILSLSSHGDHADEAVIEYPEEIDRVGYLVGHPDHTHVAATDGDLLLLADIATGDAVDVVELPADPATGAHVDDDGNLFVVTIDGSLHQFDFDTGDALASSDDVITVDEDDDSPAPSIAGGRGRVYVSAPADGVVHTFSTEDDLEQTGELDVDGAPTGLAYFGALW